MKDRKEIMLEMYRPHIREGRWEDFTMEIDRVIENAGPMTAIYAEHFLKSGEIKKIIFKFGDGAERYILEPWRELACAGNWEKECPEEYERLKGLLDEASAEGPSPVEYLIVQSVPAKSVAKSLFVMPKKFMVRAKKTALLLNKRR